MPGTLLVPMRFPHGVHGHSYTRLWPGLLASLRALAAGSAALWLAGCAEQDGAPPVGPVAEARPTELRAHGQVRTDDYHWLRDDTRSDPAVLAHIEAENAHTSARLESLAPLIRGLHDEIAGRYRPDSSTAAVRIGDFDYSMRFRAGGEQPVYVRRAADAAGPEEIVLDVNELSLGHEHYRIENWAVSPDGRHVAFLEDLTGQRRHVLRIRDLRSGLLLEDRVEDVADTLAWENGQTLVFVALDPAGRPATLARKRLGEPARVFHEDPDEAVRFAVLTARDGAGALVRRVRPGSDGLASIEGDHVTPLVPARPGHRYRLRRGGDETYLLTDLGAPDYTLRVAPTGTVADTGTWEELHAPSAGARLVDFEVFEHYAVALERGPGGHLLLVVDRASRSIGTHPLARDVEVAAFVGNPDYGARTLRYRVGSLVQPNETRVIDLATGAVRTLSTKAVHGYRANRYTTDMRLVAARDGAQVPVTLAWRDDRFRRGKGPLLLLAYGAYGVTLDPDFRPEYISLLDRGFVVAIAHVRGGQARGRAWHVAGRRLEKTNTFNDLLDVRQALIEEGFGHAGKVFLRGSSAGGLIAAYVANVAPEAFAGIIANRPFVDMLTTLMDGSLALAASELEEWGDPADPDVYDFIHSISPYDQLRTQAYPAVYATAALQDMSVGYYEPLKWIQKMRRVHTGAAPLLIDIDMSAGHSGSTEAWRRHNATAREFAFMLGVLCRSRSVCLTPSEWNRS